MDKQICIILLGKNNRNSKTNWGENICYTYKQRATFLTLKKNLKPIKRPIT